MAMKLASRRYRLAQASILLAALCLITLTWLGTINAIRAERREARARIEADASNEALAFGDQLDQKLLAFEQTLRILGREWEADPAHFDLAGWRNRAVVLSDPALQIFITDEKGIVRAGTRPELIGVDLSDRDYFRYEASLVGDESGMFISPATRGPTARPWMMNMVRRLGRPDGSFAGVIGGSYDTTALANFYRKADLGDGGMIAVVGAGGELRAVAGEESAESVGSIAGSDLFKAMNTSPDGRWTGASAPDGVMRIHAFHHLPDRNLSVVVGFDVRRALGTSDSWQRRATIFAGGSTLLVLTMAAILMMALRAARLREERMASDRAALEAAYAELEIAKRGADANTAQLEATLAGMSDGVSMFDADLNLVQWNARFSEFTGVPGELLHVGLPIEEILRVQAVVGEFGDIDIEAEVSRRMAILRAGTQNGVVERLRPNGATVELRRSGLRGGGFVTLYADITARKQAERAQRQAREQAEAAAEEKSRFVAIVSHEIRTPLNTLLNSIAILAESGLAPSHRRLVVMAKQAGDALLGLLNDILEMSKIEAGRLVLRPEFFDLRLLLEGVLDMFRVQAAARGITFSLEMSPMVPARLYADPIRLRQVLINLLSNATKFAAPGNVLLSAVAVGDGERTVLRLAVTDQGPAICEADRGRLFQPFSRIDHGGGEVKPGTGLGLAICLRLMQLMDGQIGCETTAEGGNRFWLTLPVNTASELAEANVGRLWRSGAVVPRTRILLVEDVTANQLIIATMLRQAGHCVDVASSGEAAVRAVLDRPYDLVFMDVFMPGMNGLEATRRIRTLTGPARTLPIVALTANDAAEDQARCLAAGMQGVLGKPVDAADLIAALARHVWSARLPSPPDRPEQLKDEGRTPTLYEDRIAELRQGIPPARLETLADACLGDLWDRMPALRSALVAGDAGAIESEAHAMAGVAGGYGLTALEQRLRAVLAASRRGPVADAVAIGEDLERELERADTALRQAFRPAMV